MKCPKCKGDIITTILYTMTGEYNLYCQDCRFTGKHSLYRKVAERYFQKGEGIEYIKIKWGYIPQVYRYIQREKNNA